MKSLFLLVSIVSIQIQAVTVANCPASIRATFSRFEIITAATLRNRLAPIDIEAGVAERARAELVRLAPVTVNLQRATAANAICTYTGHNHTGARFYTRRGSNILRVDTHSTRVVDNETENYRYGFYVTISDYAANQWTAAANQNPGIIYEEDDPEANFLAQRYGRAMQFNLGIVNRNP